MTNKRLHDDDSYADDNEFVDEVYEQWKNEGLSYAAPDANTLKRLKEFLDESK